MSHFVRIQTEIREREHLMQALRDLNYQFQVGEELPVRGFPGQERAEIVVATGSNYDIGFRRQIEQYEVVADWWGVETHTPIRQRTFLEQLNQRYSYNLIKEHAREQCLVVEEEQTLPNGDIVLVLSERG